MSYKINFENYSNSFAVPECIMDNDISVIDSDYIKLALFIIRNCKKTYSSNLLSNLLNIDEHKINKALNFWKTKGLLSDGENLKLDADVIMFSNSKKSSIQPSFQQSNTELSYLIECIESRISRPLTGTEYRTLSNIIECTNLPVDVVLMAVEYCISIDKMTPRYIEKVCAGWADANINTHELAEQYLKFSKKAMKNENAVKKIFGIENRNLIESEKKYISTWFNEFHFGVDMITCAYEKTIMAISKLSFPYINKILLSWHENGYTTADEVKNEGKTSLSYNNDASYDLEEITRFLENNIQNT